jgi:transcriptional regulator with XRE-family HTH domain
MKKNQITELRKKRDISQHLLGSLIGVNQKRIAKIESCPESVSFGQIKKVLEAMGARLVVVEDEYWQHPSPKEKSFVYVLHHKILPVIKIGKSDNIALRASQIGAIDPELSFAVQVNSKNVLKLEKILHRTFSKWSISCDDAKKMGINNDGASEWFEASCKNRIIVFLEGNSDLLECEMFSLNSGCPYCQSNIDSWYGLGLAVYDCMSKETIDGKIQQSDLCKDKCKHLD